MEALLGKMNVDVNKANFDGRTPLFAASQTGHSTQVVKVLLDAGADVNKPHKKWGQTPIFCASQNGHFEVVRALLNAKAEVNQSSSSGETPLSRAQVQAICSRWEVVGSASSAGGGLG